MMINGVEVVDTFAEAFPMTATRLVLTADSPRWAEIAGRTMTGYATSVIGCDADAGIERARGADSADPRVRLAQRYQRAAQFYADFVEAENSMGFHADQEAMRILALSLDESRRGQAVLPGSKATPGAETKLAPTPQQVSPGTRPGSPER